MKINHEEKCPACLGTGIILFTEYSRTKMTPAKVEAARRLLKKGFQTRVVARTLQVHPGSIHWVKKNKSRKNAL